MDAVRAMARLMGLDMGAVMSPVMGRALRAGGRAFQDGKIPPGCKAETSPKSHPKHAIKLANKFATPLTDGGGGEEQQSRIWRRNRGSLL